MKKFSLFLTLLFLGFAVLVPASMRADDALPRPIQTSIDDMELMKVGTVSEVIRSDLIKLDSGKRYIIDNVRIAPIYSTAVADYLRKRLIGKTVGIYKSKLAKDVQEDESGNIYGQMQTEDGVWVQGDLVSRGLAWASSTNTKRDLIMPLYKREIKAREGKQGLWAEPQYSIRNERNIKNYINTFQVFDGKVTKVDNVGDVVLYFGKSDDDIFSAVIDMKYLQLFWLTRYERINFLDFIGVRVRIRGWVKADKDGDPMIELTHPEQIEFSDFDKMSREEALKADNHPPVMPYDIKIEIQEKKKKKR